MQGEKDTVEVVERVAEEDEVMQKEGVRDWVETGQVDGVEDREGESEGLSLLVTH